MARTVPSAATSLLLTCEHASNRVPREFAGCFRGAAEALKSHRGYDPGAIELAQRLRDELGVPLLVTDVSRLLVECNRSAHHKDLFSRFTRELDRETKRRILDTYYFPHRRAVESHITAEINRGRAVVHVGVHSFTPVLNGEERRADIGLLYDPGRHAESELALKWQSNLTELDASLLVRRNYPYRGASDGLTTSLRRMFPERRYLGIELEVNNKHLVGRSGSMRRRVTEAVVESLRSLLDK